MAKNPSSSIEKNLITIKAGDIMSRYAITTKVKTRIDELAHLIMRFKISGIPVVSEKGDIVGIVTATDLFNKMEEIISTIEQGADPIEIYRTSIEGIMKREVYTITADTTLYDVIKMMCSKKIHTLPVVSGSEIIGIVGRRDVINACYTLALK